MRDCFAADMMVVVIYEIMMHTEGNKIPKIRHPLKVGWRKEEHIRDPIVVHSRYFTMFHQDTSLEQDPTDPFPASSTSE